MKVQQLLEARIKQDEFYVSDTVPSQKDKSWCGRYKFIDKHIHYASKEEVSTELEDLKWQGRIVLAIQPPVKTQGLDQEAVKKAYEKAKAKFLELRSAHKDQLRFKTAEEAYKYMKTMEYPGWTIAVQRAHLNWRTPSYHEKNQTNRYEFHMDVDWKNSRKVKTLDLETQEFKAPYHVDEFSVELDGERVRVSAPEKTGPKFSAFLEMISNVSRKSKLKAFSAKGVIDDVFYTRPQKVWFQTKDIDAIKKAMDNWWTKHHDELSREHAGLQNKLADRKEASKFSAAMQKEKKAALYKKYGKEIVDAVKVRPMSLEGDDGYQWALFVNGRRTMSGMTQYQADGEQRMMWAWMLKWQNMTPKEQLDHMNAVKGWQAYFALERMERSLDHELPKYLDAIKKNAKNYIDAKTAAKDAIETSKVSDEQAKKIFKDLMNKMSDKK